MLERELEGAGKMKAHMRTLIMVAFTAILLGAVALVGGCTTDKTAKAEALVQEKCSQCHDLSRIDEVPPNADWDQIIQMMIDVYQAPSTPEEKAIMAAHLTEVTK